MKNKNIDSINPTGVETLVAVLLAPTKGLRGVLAGDAANE